MKTPFVPRGFKCFRPVSVRLAVLLLCGFSGTGMAQENADALLDELSDAVRQQNEAVARQEAMERRLDEIYTKIETEKQAQPQRVAQYRKEYAPLADEEARIRKRGKIADRLIQISEELERRTGAMNLEDEQNIVRIAELELEKQDMLFRSEALGIAGGLDLDESSRVFIGGRMINRMGVHQPERPLPDSSGEE